MSDVQRTKRLVKARQVAKQRQLEQDRANIEIIASRLSEALIDSLDKTYRDLLAVIPDQSDVVVDTQPIAEQVASIKSVIESQPNVAQEIRELMAGIVAKLEPRVIEVEKVVPLEAKAPIVQVSKASDDIYARYDYAASNTEIDGTYIGYEQQSGAWFIQRIANGAQGQISTFTTGKKDFSAAWLNRLKLKYYQRSEVVIP